MKQFHISHTYDTDVWRGGVYDTAGKTEAAIAALLNPIRQKAARALGMKKELYLSVSYVLYCFQWEQSKAFLRDMAALEHGSPAYRERLAQPVADTFTPFDFFTLVKQYGLVPLSAMPDALCHHKSDSTYVLNNRLRLGAKQLAAGEATAEEIIQSVKSVLDEGLGAFPTTFSLSFITTAGKIQTLENLTPQAFWRDYCGTNPDDYRCCADSTLALPDERFLPLDTAQLKAAVVRQLQGGEQVVVCADTRHQANQLLGILDTDFIDESDMFGGSYRMTKAEKQAYGILQPTALLSLDGTATDGGTALRFKAQDVHGAATGADGHYTMAANWFDEYVLYAVIHRRYLEA